MATMVDDRRVKLHRQGSGGRYWVWWLGDSSEEIISKVSAELVCSTYIGLHTVDPKQAIVMLKDAVKWD